MLNSQGLGEMVSRKKDAYQNNPQALQQRYQQSQELVDLLALQQLKSEKEAAARNMQMQMQQNPATIAQQREQEVLGMIKQEQGRKLGDVAQRTAGTLGEINKRAQQNVQRTAKQGLPTMRSPQRRMAQGGIIGFKEGGGGEISEEQIAESYGNDFLNYVSENPAELASLGLMFVPGLGLVSAGARGVMALGKVLPKLGQLAQKFRRKKDTGPDFEVTPKGTAVPKDRSQIPSTSKEMVPYRGDPSRPVDPGKQLSDPRLQQVGPSRRMDFSDAKPIAARAGLEQFLPEKQEDMGGAGVLAPKPEPKPEPDAETKTSPEPVDFFAGIGELKPVKPEFGTMARDAVEERARRLGLAGAKDGDPTPEEARDAEQERVMKLLGKEEKLGVKDSQLRRLQELQERQMDPDKLRKERFRAGLIGAAGRGSTALAGFGAGAFNQRVQQEAAERKALTDQFGIENEKIKLDFDITGAGIGSGMEAFEINKADRRAIASDMTKATDTDIELGKAFAQQVFESDKTNLTSRLTRASAAAQRALDEAKGRREAIPKLITEYNKLIKTKFDVYQELQKNSDLMMAFRSGDKERIERALLQTEIAGAQLAELTQVHAAEELIESELRALGANIPTSSGLTSGDAELDRIMQMYGSM
jgi:hypothetical protein